MNREFVKSYNAETALVGNLIAKFGAADYGAAQAAAATDILLGVVDDQMTYAIGDRADIIHEGIAFVLLGGTVARSNFVTSDANGKGVVAAPAAGANVNVIGRALQSGVAGDIIEVLLNIIQIQG